MPILVFEQQLMRSMYQENSEKTYIDKLLGRRDVDRTKVLITKQNLTREEISELLHMLHSTESKLYNFSSYERYVILKFFVWIREFVKVSEILFDAQDLIKKKDDNKEWCLSDTSKSMMANNVKLIEHNTKFLTELYLNICRTTLSLGGTGFLELLKNKFEMSYPESTMQAGNVSDSRISRWLSFSSGKNRGGGNQYGS